jgi:probable HAF family extracellular repeat protein
MKKLIALGLLFVSISANAVEYNIAVLEGLGGDSKAYGLNESGQVVGNAFNSNTGLIEAVIWNNGVIQSLGFQGIARAVNNSGTVVGENGLNATSNNTGDGRAYKWDSVNGYQDLGDLNGIYAGAWDINESGVITGSSFYNNDTAFGLFSQHAFRWENGTMTDLEPPNATAGYSRGIAINEAGTVIGRAAIDTFTNSDKYMAQWDSSGSFFHDTPPGNYSAGRDINNLDIAVGISRLGTDTPNLAAIWDADGNVTILGTLGGNRSELSAINDSGIAVGMAEAAGNAKTAMAVFDGATVVDLNSLVDLSGTGIVRLTEAFDINGNGDIVGIGVTASGETKAFLMTAVPVPAAVWLFGSALGLLGWLRRGRTAA